MSARGIVRVVPLVAVLYGCSAHGGQPTPGARAEFIDVNGKDIGSAVLFQQSDGVRIRTDVRSLPAGDHGFHVHSVGVCDPPFQTAGAHVNPLGRKHGSINSDGPHAGDLANLPVPSNGTARVDVVAPGLSLAQLSDEDGSALVIHAAPDDYKTDPSGNSGARIACAIIRK